MKVDRQTLVDLEAVPGGRRNPTLLAHLDRTSTKGGWSAWKRRLTRPLHSVEAIREVQEALRFILSNRALLDGLPTDDELQALDRYLHSAYTTIHSTRWPTLLAESAWVRVRYPDLYREALDGRALIGIVWRRMLRIARGLAEGPKLLADFGAEIEAIVDPELAGRLIGDQHGRGWRSWERALSADRVAREERRDSLLRLLAVAHELDALRSMAIVTEEMGFCLPEVHCGDSRLEVTGIWHPFVGEPVRNDVMFEGDGRLMFLTGANMAGKSTYIKACGITVLLAHVGMGVPARSCALGLVARLVCATRTEDNLWHGLSYFQAEARRVRCIAEWISLDERCVVLVDELFRGTNVKDAIDTTEAVLRGFCRAEQGWFVLASHLIEVAARVRELPEVVFRRFEAHLEEGELRFPYRLRDGVSDQRLGMRVLHEQGVFAALERIGMSKAEPRDPLSS